MENRLNRARIGSGRVLGPLNGLTLAVLIVSLVLSSCTTVNQTPGQRFRELMQRMAEICVEKNLPPTDSRCVLPSLEVADTLETPEGRFAHSLKIPNPVSIKEPQVRPASIEEYFGQLCSDEAGEFIFRTVSGVKGIYEMRPRSHRDARERRHLFAQEDPYGDQRWAMKNPQDYFIQPPWGRFEFYEKPSQIAPSANETKAYVRYIKGNPAHDREFVYMDGGRSRRVPYIVAMEKASQIMSRFGYTWRGLRRLADRELGIAGGELIVLDLETSEVLAVRRGFVRGNIDKKQMGFVWSRGCPMTSDVEFIYKVLRPGSQMGE